MQYRKLDEDGDYTFGHGPADMLTDSPETVGQAVATRLRLLAGEWFLDLQEGTPYETHILGKHTQDTYDRIIRARILETEGVNEIIEYESIYDGETRTLAVVCSINTTYGETTVTTDLQYGVAA